MQFEANKRRDDIEEIHMTSTFTHGYALLIGVGDSAYPPWSLPTTVKDVRAIHAALTDLQREATTNAFSSTSRVPWTRCPMRRARLHVWRAAGEC